ncbi:MAG: D-alanyl-D-alanine carboxypeptidase [Proteobacteria bacterium]|nr:D-alanyl-D-alanine carboxypeptidase [Pseudomonadota bacterium]
MTQYKRLVVSFVVVLSLFSSPALALNKKSNKQVKQNNVVKAKNNTVKKDKLAKAEKPAKESKVPEAKECKAELLVDAASGEALFEKNSEQPLAPASMTKLMTTFVVMNKLETGSITLNDQIPISAKASKTGGSQVYLKEGEKFSLDQLIHALLIQSANDAAIAISEYVGGSTEGFVELMNQEAKSLGMTQSEFHSPHGLPPAEGQLPDLVSARDFGILARALVIKFPSLLEITRKGEEDFRDGEFKMSNHNKLLKTFAGCDGLKTGYYAEAGFSVTVTAEKNNSRMFAVVMGCNDRKFRDEEAAKLLTQGFSQFKTVKLIDKGQTVDTLAKVENGMKQETALATAEEVKVSIRNGDESKIEKKFQLCDKLVAPVSPHTFCGELVYRLNDKEIGRTKLVSTESVDKVGWARGMFNKIDLY